MTEPRCVTATESAEMRQVESENGKVREIEAGAFTVPFVHSSVAGIRKRRRT